MSTDIFFASAHFLYQISIFQSSFLVLRFLLFICKRTSVLGVCYLFTKDCGPSLTVLYTGCCPCYLFCLQRTTVLVFRYSFAKKITACESKLTGLKSSSTVVLLVEKPFMRLQTGTADC